MKLKSIGRAALATGMSLAIGFGPTACSRDFTVAYVYATSQQNNTVSAYAVDYQSGALTQINGSPFTGTGNTPVAMAVTPDGNFLYVVSKLDSNVVEYAIGTDGKLYGQNTYNLTGSFGTSATIDSTGTYLYVTYQFQTGYTSGSPGPGGISIFPITQSGSNVGSLGTAINVNVGNTPVSVAVSNPTVVGSASNVYVYVVDQETQTTGPTVLGFLQNPSNGSLTPLSGTNCTTTAPTACTGYSAGVQPSAVVVEPTTKYVYVTDESSNAIIGYQIGGAGPAAGSLTALTTSPFSTGTGTGLFPENLTIEPRGKFIYTANFNSNTVSAFAINISNGSLSGVATSGSAAVATGPTCVTVEPALGLYLYTSNNFDSSISGEKIDANTGALSAIDNTPFPTAAQPSCVTAVANGNHAHAQEVIVN